MVVNDTKISQKIKDKSLLSVEKSRIRKKCLIIILRKYFNIENFASL